MVSVVAYIRVSTDRQANDGTSLVTQRRCVLEHVTYKGYKLLKLFVEEGQSAKTDKRPKLQEMLRYCEENSGTVDLLIFPKVDRFARYSEDYHHLKRRLRDLGIRIESIDERFDDSPAGRFLESMLAASAQFDNDVKSQRTYLAMKEAVTEGRWLWQAPLGYRNVRVAGRANIEPDPRTAPIVIEVFERIARKRRTFEVREWLRDQGIPMSRGGFHKMLGNKLYIGMIEAFGVQVRASEPFVPLISDSLFLRAQEAIDRPGQPLVHERDHEDFPLRGTVRCTCGQYLVAGWSSGRKKKYAYYRCHKCARVNLSREWVEKQFHDTFRILRKRIQLELITNEMRDFWYAEIDQMQVRHKELLRERDKITALQKALLRKVAEGVVPDKLATEQFEEYDLMILKIDAQISETKETNREPNIDTLIDFAGKLLGEMERMWHEASTIHKKRIQNFFFPEGALTGVGEKVRTAFDRLLTGSTNPFIYPTVSFGAPQLQNCEKSCPHKRIMAIRLDFLKKLYGAFGSEEEMPSVEESR